MPSLGQLKTEREQVRLQIESMQGTQQQIQQKIGALVSGAKQSLIPEARRDAEERISAIIRQLASASTPKTYSAGWQDAYWSTWEPNHKDQKTLVRIGELRGKPRGVDLAIPVFVPLVGNRQTVVIPDEGYAGVGFAAFHSIIIRSALLLPNQVSFTLLDPAHHGLSYPMSQRLPQQFASADEIRQQILAIDKVIQHRARFIVGDQTDSFEKADQDIVFEEPYHLVFAADFPSGYDRRTIESLQGIARSGPRAGVFLFIHLNLSAPFPYDTGMEGFESLFVAATSGMYTGLGLQLVPDAPPATSLQAELLEKLEQLRPPDRSVAAADILPPRDKWWSGTAQGQIRAPIGRPSDRSQSLEVWFGSSADGLPCSHGILGGYTGAGKSVSLHAIISSFATRYPPDELRFYLVDGKDGVEFQAYRNLPHAEVISLRTTPEMARSVLADLLEEMAQRNDEFVDKGVNSYDAYRSRGLAMPRILLIVDEYQMLFEDDRFGSASDDLLLLAQQGRSAGIHMLLGSQSFAVPGLAHRQQVFGNIHMRMAMRLVDSDRRDLTDFGRDGKELIQKCDRPGQIVVNAYGGDDQRNVLGKVAFVSKEEAAGFTQEVRALAAERYESVPQPVVFDGLLQPNFGANAWIDALRSPSSWLTPVEREHLAHKSLAHGGFGIPDWYASDIPYIAVLGRTFSVRGQAAVLFRRQMGENLLLVSDDSPTRCGTLAAVTASLALNAAPPSTEFYVIEGQDEADVLKEVVDLVLVPAGFVNLFRAGGDRLEAALGRLSGVIAERAALPSRALREAPTLFLVLTEPERISALRRQPDRFGDLAASELGKQLVQVLRDGPAVGVHSIVAFTGAFGVRAILDLRLDLESFRHRVATQMSEDDSHSLLRTNAAARLQTMGRRPVCALYRDIVSDSSTRFKPFSEDPRRSEEGPTISESLREIGAILEQRSSQS